MNPNLENGLYIGKEEIKLKDSFYELPFVKQVLKNYDCEIKLNPLILNAVH